jgi:hypothetical protein
VNTNAINTVAFNANIPTIGDDVIIDLQGDLLQITSARSGNDFSSLSIPGQQSYYARFYQDGVPGSNVEVQIAKWQATQRVEGRGFLQVSIPSVNTELLNTVETSDSFAVVSRVTLVDGSTSDVEIASTLIDSFNYYQGSLRASIIARGYSQSLNLPEDSVTATRSVDGVRQLTSGTNGYRVRCSINSFLRPGDQLDVQAVSFKVGAINYYVNDFDAFMDVVSR